MFKDIKLFGTGSYTGRDGLTKPSKPTIINEVATEEE